ncbi:hypothetical protein SERLA73DRAFT_110133 [Serpula lacrymans var. lacrymans S7.3]|uniref:Uncharacterized protein n=2 Tax=Serpula lacrymans var. lacrymans TaxID=341189 RepID=F8Q0C5_SERL3|nr:uncharacterized protein SERLADRAFT_470934 [Serpula lacrymans var. lacrymans S7.9]EGN98575.1 hypothetical protein SERLA73DRAFT_110133 [Serpula lacrymans var. lacrymans S7.3]EGO24140.1 hypothetical protein SERLADRAFT_470934 [Serpula lacrymans var. lacrymans S7.9]
MPHAQQIHTGDPAYASPVIRAPSPASSVGTAYGPDETSLSDMELSQDAFEKKCLEALKLDWQKEEEIRADRTPLIQKPKTQAEEIILYENIVRNLRRRVQQLEDDELFEQTLLRGSQVALEQQPSSNDMDALMKSLMTTTLSNGSNTAPNISNGPWNSGPRYNNEGMSRMTAGKQNGKGKGRSFKP